jgi:hypothetical protein
LSDLTAFKLNLIVFQVGADNNLLVKEHTHTFVNKGGTIGGMFCYLIPTYIQEQCSYAGIIFFLIALELLPVFKIGIENCICIVGKYFINHETYIM